MTEQAYLSVEKIEQLRTQATKELEIAVGQTKMILVDLTKVRPFPKVSKRDSKPYQNYVLEIKEFGNDNDEIDREIEVTEFQLGKIAEMLYPDKAGTLSVTGEKNGEYVRRKYAKI